MKELTIDPLATLRARMLELGVTISGSQFVKEYDEEYAGVVFQQSPIVALSAEKWIVVDVDNDQGTGEFWRRLRLSEMPGLHAFVVTDKGVLLVYEKAQAHKCDIPGDVRYERISQERGHYDMRCLFKKGGAQRSMVPAQPSLGCKQLYPLMTGRRQPSLTSSVT